MVLKGKKKKISLWLSSSVAGKDREGMRWEGVKTGILTSPTTGGEKRCIAEGEKAVKSISILNQTNLQTVDSLTCPKEI